MPLIMVYKNKIDFTKKKYYNKAVLLEQNLKLIMVYFKSFMFFQIGIKMLGD